MRFKDARGFAWRVTPRIAPFAEKVLAPNLHRLERFPGARLIKTSTTRAVFAVTPEDPALPPLIVKRHVVRDLFETLKFTALGTRARKEWDVLEALDRVGIPVPKAVAVAERRVGGMVRGAVLVLEKVSFRDHLPGALSGHIESGPRKGLIEDLGRLVRRLHDHGFDHHDLHSGNFLVIRNAAGGVDPFPLDFHAVVMRSRISRAARIRGLGQLLFSCEVFMDDADRDRFVRAYLETPTIGVPRMDAASIVADPEAFRADIDREAAVRRRRRILSRTRRCVKRSTGFRRERRDGLVVRRRADLLGETVFAAIRRHAAMLVGDHAPEGTERIYKNHPKTAVTRVALPGEGPDLCVKEFKPRGFFVRVWRSITGSKARRAWLNAHGLRVRGVSTPKPMALVDVRGVLGVLGGSYFIAEVYRDGQPLDRWFRDPALRTLLLADHGSRRALMERIGELLDALHVAKIHHADLAPKNWLVRREGETWRVALVDTEDVRLDRGPSPAEMRMALTQLYDQPEILSAKDRMRFMKRYGR